MQEQSDAPTFRLARRVVPALLIAAVAAPAPSQAAKPRPDLIPAPVAAVPASVRPGDAFRVTVTVRNAGRRRAPRTTVGFLLSTDKRRDARDVPLPGAASARALERGKKVRTQAGLTAPPNLAPGAYHLLACADGRKKVKEASERNNCAAGRSRITVVAPQPSDPAPTPPDSGGGGPAEPPPPQPPPADPLGARTVDPQLVRENAATGAFDVEGGVLRHEAEDGSVYTLALPPGAVAEPISIKLVPIRDVGRLPFSHVAGVQLEPRGFVLQRPATLTIEPATPVSLPEQTAFAYHGARSQLNLEPPLPRAELTLPLVTLAGFGLASATDAQRTDQLRFVPTAPENALAQDVSEPARELRLAGSPRGFAGSSGHGLTSLGDPVVEIANRLQAERPAVISDLLAAQTDASLAPSALRRAMALERLSQLFGNDDDADPRITELMVKAILNHLFTALDRCLALGDPVAALIALSDARQLALLGAEQALLDDVAAQILEPIRRCFRFDLDFETALEVETESHGRAFVLHARFTGLRIGLGPTLETTSEPKALAYDVTSLNAHCEGEGRATRPFTLTAFHLVGFGAQELVDSAYGRLRITADIGETEDVLSCADTCSEFECDVDFQFPSPGRGAATGVSASAYVQQFTSQAFTLDRKVGSGEEEIRGVEDLASTCGGAPVWLRLIDAPRRCTFRHWDVRIGTGDAFATWRDETERGETTLRLHHRPKPDGPLED